MNNNQLSRILALVLVLIITLAMDLFFLITLEGILFTKVAISLTFTFIEFIILLGIIRIAQEDRI
jgi:hypothetical protein